MGNTSARPHPRQRNKKQVHWKAADRPTKPGKPQLVTDTDSTPDVITIRWDRPIKDGGAPIIGYLVEHRRTGSPHWVRATPLLVPFPELIISGLEPGWRYQFRVSAENVVGTSDPSEVSEPLAVTLQRSAITSPRFTQELTDTIALENEKVEFVVYFLGQPPPKISWFKDGFEIFSSRRIRILTESDRSVLTIHQSQLVDAGEIKCAATNKAGHATTRAILTLEAPPSIRLPRQYEEGLLFEIGEVIRLKISIAGLPVPLVFWSHNGESIQNTERYEIETYDNSTMLKITEAKRSDRGEYQVKAINKLGQSQASFLVTVTDKPTQPGKARVLMTLGKSVTLAWNTPEDDGGCKIGNYIIEYYRLGWDVWLKAATSRQLTAVLGDLIEGSQYKFRVKAESPYGISEPSEESDIVFIPDTKRGILNPPPPRSASQPREFAEGRAAVPELPQRKHKPRSQSSSRAEDHHVQFSIPNAMPTRPDRTKVKTPQRTPEASPGVVRRELNAEIINKAIFDRSSMTRDLSYGTPEFKVHKKEDETRRNEVLSIESKSPLGTPDTPKPKSTIQIIDNRRPRSPSPMINKSSSPQLISRLDRQDQNRYQRNKSPSPNQIPERTSRSRTPSPQRHTLQQSLSLESSRSPSPSKRLQNTRSPSPNYARKSSKDFGGSSEFMLVLLPNESKDRDASDIDVNFDENQIPPPLSLSAPELGTEPPVLEGLKYSASSTELLHERAMIRFYEAAQAEELELKRKLEKKDSQERRGSGIPKIQINSEDEDSVGIERKVSLRRRYSGGINAPQQILWTQRRHSLRNSGDLQEMLEGKLKRYPLSIEERREIMLNRNRSQSEEKEEEELEKIRSRTDKKRPELIRKKNIDIVDLSKWDQYEESSEESSEDERIYDQVPDVNYEEEEDVTYHPTMRAVEKRTNNEPFEILTKPTKPPDPNFVPKPILKRGSETHSPQRQASPQRQQSPQRPQSPPIISNTDKKSVLSSLSKAAKWPDRRPSAPLPSDIKDQKLKTRSLGTTAARANKPEKRRSLPWSAPIALAISEEENKEEEGTDKKDMKPLPSISAVASISGLAMAGIAIPKVILAKKAAEEEAKVVADHYGDIVRSYGQKKILHQPVTSRTYETDEIVLSKIPQPQPEQAKRIERQTEIQKTSGTFREDDVKEAKRPHLFNTESLNEARTSPIYGIDNSTSENTLKYNGRIRTDSSSSSQISTSSSKSGRYRRGSPTVLNKEIAAFRNERNINPPEPAKPTNRSPPRKRTPSKSPGRTRKTSESPRRWNMSPSKSTFSTQTDIIMPKKKSPSPVPVKKAPKMKEIMTQTSTCIDNFITETAAKISGSFKKLDDQELKEYAEKKVRSTVDYVTDLAMFAVACWLYVFNNELFAIPVLLVMVYRQLQTEISKRIPNWLVRKFKKEQKET